MIRNFDKYKTFGRYKVLDDKVIFYNGGSGLSFKMKGARFKVDLANIGDPGSFRVFVDKNYNYGIQLPYNQSEVIISFETYEEVADPNGIHYVDIVKVNEANDNELQISNIHIYGKLLDYDFKYKYKIKVYGDSTIAGYGILAHEGPTSVKTNSSVKDFCFRALYELGADFDIFSASGWGLVFSKWTNPNEIGIIDFKDNLCVHSNEKWVEKDKTDLLIISLGTNDYSYIGLCDSMNRVNIFKETYKKLIDSELEKNKDLKILMIYGTLKEKDVYPLIEETYEYLKPFYKNLFIHKFDGDNSAIEHHAYVDKHEEMANELKEVITQIMDK